MKKINSVLCLGLALVLSGCGSAPKVEPISTPVLEAAVAEVVGLKKAADIDQADLLSFEEYTDGLEYLGRAQHGLASNYEGEYILEKAARGKAQLQQALKNSLDRTPNAVRILESRKSTLDAGVKNSLELAEALADLDDDLRDETDNFARSLEPLEFSEFQKKYFALEIKAVQFRELDAVKESIQGASRKEAKDLAPRSLRTAMLDVSEAENLIAQSPRDPRVYQVILDLAIGSSIFLTDVMQVILDAPGTPEDVAARIVDQNRQLEALSRNVGSLQKDLKATQSTLVETESSLKQKETALIETEGALKLQDLELKSARTTLLETETALILQNEQLEKSSMQIRFQRAMDQAVEEFSDEEASVYQKSSKLIFRLKKINFASGSATIPAASKPILAKINDIIKNLGAELVAVEGHTDSVGAAELNKNLSTKRAVSVAKYLASLAGGYKTGYVGYGESRPIASNDTKIGRAINRRVDLVVTARK
ncbi:MAG: OmpA family protein [Gammaproteobacteria bacterium]|nr:OmpA family protein [Gammaproteobacteria bacterium]